MFDILLSGDAYVPDHDAAVRQAAAELGIRRPDDRRFTRNPMQRIVWSMSKVHPDRRTAPTLLEFLATLPAEDGWTPGEHYDAVPEIAASQGRDALHDIEARVLLDALADPDVVVAGAASVVDRDETRAALEAPFVVWVDAPVEVLRARFESRAHRPRYEQDVGHMLREQLARRGPWLERLADLRVDATRPVPELVEQVVTALPG